ncbi:MAG: spore germination protein [Clostridiales bacterium]|nr:spore germination protein [Clostridiales bacterium]
MKTKTPLFKSLQRNIDYMKSQLDGSADFTVKDFTLKNDVKCAVITMEGLVDKNTLGQSILNPIISGDMPCGDSKNVYEYISKNIVAISETKDIDCFEDAFVMSMSGFALICVDKYDKMLACGVQGYSYRSIAEPETEITQRGSREGFVEPIKINMTLLRRRIKSPALKFEQMQIGTLSNTLICMCYLSDRVDKKILENIKQRLNDIDCENILSSAYIAEYLENNTRTTMFSTVGISERPDAVCGKISEGRVAILIDGTPSVLIAPYLFCESFQTMDDYCERPFYATFSRWLKYLAFFIAVFTPGLYVSAVIFNPEIFPEQMLTKIALSVADTPFPIVWEVLIIHFIYEIMREAGLRLPRSLGHAVSIVGGLVIGDAAVSAGLIGAPTLMVVALTAISSYVIPDIYGPVAILRLILIIVAGFSGLWGIVTGGALIVISICSLKSYGVPFTAPFAPFMKQGMRDSFIRESIKKLSKRRYLVNNTKGFEENAQN